MIDPQDYYGNNYKWFIGKVKDTQDPFNANRVRVQVFGVHPIEIEDANYGSSSGGPAATTGTTTSPGGVIIPSGASGAGGTDTTPPAASTVGAITPNYNNLPNHSAVDNKLSQYFTLRDLTIGTAVCSALTKQKFTPEFCTEQVIKNLANLAQSALDPLKTNFNSNIKINSAWRAPGAQELNTQNHPSGYAADVSLNSSGVEIANYMLKNLKGRFNMLLLEYNNNGSWAHIQLGSKTGTQGSTSSPLIQTIDTRNGKTYSGLQVLGR